MCENHYYTIFRFVSLMLKYASNPFKVHIFYQGLPFPHVHPYFSTIELMLNVLRCSR